MKLTQALRAASTRASTSLPALYRNLIIVGLTGAVYRCREDADIVNDAVEALLSDPRRFRVGRGLAQAIAGDASYAVRTMGERIDKNPEDDMAKIVLGAAKMLAGDADWKFSIDNVLALSTNVAHRERAMNLLSTLQKVKPKR